MYLFKISTAIKVLMAPKWEWLQKIETVKREMRQLVSSLMTTDSVVIHVFDQKFNYIGKTKLLTPFYVFSYLFSFYFDIVLFSYFVI
jgi:hypothetical protein